MSTFFQRSAASGIHTKKLSIQKERSRDSISSDELRSGSMVSGGRGTLWVGS